MIVQSLSDKSLMSALYNNTNTSLSTYTDRSWDLFWLSHSYILLWAQSTGLSQKNFCLLQTLNLQLNNVSSSLNAKHYMYILSHRYYSRLQISFWHFGFDPLLLQWKRLDEFHQKPPFIRILLLLLTLASSTALSVEDTEEF